MPLSIPNIVYGRPQGENKKNMGLPRKFSFRHPWLYTTILDTKARHTNKSHASFSHHHSLSFIYLFIFSQNLPTLEVNQIIKLLSLFHTPGFLLKFQFAAKKIILFEGGLISKRFQITVLSTILYYQPKETGLKNLEQAKNLFPSYFFFWTIRGSSINDVTIF